MKMSRLASQALVCISGFVAAAALSTPVLAANGVPSYNKIVLVIEENQSYDNIIGNSVAPWTNLLSRAGALMTTSYGTEHPSQPNYLDLFSGSDQNVTDDAHPTQYPLFTGENLGAQLLHANNTFAIFSENLPYPGDTTDDFGAAPGDPTSPVTHDYARKHNPVADFQNDADPATPYNLGSNYLPSFVNQTFAPFAAIVQSGNFQNLPDFSIVVPNQQHDDHGISGGLQGNDLIHAGDVFLQANFLKYAKWALANNSLLIVTWDEDDYAGTNQIPTIFFGAHVKSGQFSEPNSITYVSTVNADTGPQGAPVYVATQGINHWNVLRTIEDSYGFGHIGGANKVSTITDIFSH